jgi:hypothetical protein
VQEGLDDPEFLKFMECYKARQRESMSPDPKARNIWIVKPGENTNRGTGISVLSDLGDIRRLVGYRDYHPNGKRKTHIIQTYLDRPFLYHKRKFDIRCYILMTSVNGRIKGFWYHDGYIRTSSKEFSLKNLGSRMVHLTNDAVQKKGEEYGRFEPGNKVTSRRRHG